MQHTLDPATGTMRLTAPHAETVMGITVTRPAGYVWHAGKWPVRIRDPSPAMVAASYWHDAAYEDLPWTWGALAVADLGFVVVYLRHGGGIRDAALMWCGLAMWSSLTAATRTKPLKWRNG